MCAYPAVDSVVEVRWGSRAVIRGAIVAALGGFLLGFDTVVISGANEALKDVFNLDSFWLGFTVAVAMMGTICGAVITGKPADLYGRRKALFAMAICYFISAIGCGFARSWEEFLVARFIGGLAIGGASVVSPMYIAEISPPHLRGRLVTVSQLNLVVGILLCYVSNYVVAQCVEFNLAWRWMLGLAALPSVFFFLLIFGIPESPRWLVKAARPADARKSLERLGEPDVEGRLTSIQASLADRPGHQQDRLFQRAYVSPMLLASAFAVLNQLTGINAILYYAPAIFSMAGAARDSALLQSVAIGGTILFFTIAAMFIIDRFGRRILMLIGSAGMATCLALVASEFSSTAGSRRPLFLLAALLSHIAFFAFSQGSVIWVFISEIFPNAVRAKGQALGWFIHWIMAAAITWTFPVIAEASGAGAFGFFSAMMVLQFLFAWRIMPETKGGTLEDIEKRLTRAGGNG
jgi:MFS transporter, SP family, xylose:H+ symportor